MSKPDLVQAYRETDYHFAERVLTINKPSTATATLLKPFAPKGGLFITACNPMGKVVDSVSNKLANNALEKDLLSQGLTVIAGYGEGTNEDTGEKHKEDSFFAYPVDRQTSLDLCIKYEQNAVVYVDSNGLPSLKFHPAFENQ